MRPGAAINRQETNQPLSILLRQINAALRGWTVFFRHGVSKQTFAHLNRYTWLRVVGWLRLLKALDDGAQAPDGVLASLPLGDGDGDGDGDDVAASARAGVRRTLELPRAWLANDRLSDGGSSS